MSESDDDPDFGRALLRRIPKGPIGELLRNWQIRALLFRVKDPKQQPAERWRRVNDPEGRIAQILLKAGFPLYMTSLGYAFKVSEVDPWIAEQIDSDELLDPDDLSASLEVTAEAPAADPLRWVLVDQALVEKKLIDIPIRSGDQRQRDILVELRLNPQRALPAASLEAVRAVRELAHDFPNFQTAIDRVAQSIALAARLKGPLAIPKLLLYGEPGTGKTEFARRLAEALNLHFVSLSLPQVSAGWILCGSAGAWRDAREGLVARSVLDCPDGRIPLIFFDELDKVAGSMHFPVEPTLLHMLEPATACRFMDEYLGLPIDVRPVGMIFAANRLTASRPETLDRLEPVEVRRPTLDEMPAVVRSVDRSIRAGNPAIDQVFEPLGNEVIAGCSRLRPRQVMQVLKRAYARAAENAPPSQLRIRIEPGDLGIPDTDRPGPEATPLMAEQRQKQDEKQARAMIEQLLALILWEPRSGH